MKRVKKKTQPKITITTKERDKMLNMIYKKALSYAVLTTMAAMFDELKIKENIILTEDQLCNIAQRADTYASHLEKHEISLKEMTTILKKNTNLTFIWE